MASSAHSNMASGVSWKVKFLVLALCVFWSSPTVEGRRRNCLDQALEAREESANVVFTGTVHKLMRDSHHPRRYKGEIEIKRVIKGDNVITRIPGHGFYNKNYRSPWHKVVMVEGFGDPHICDSYVRKFDTRIFLLNEGPHGELKLNSSVVRLTLNNIDRADAAVQNMPFKPKQFNEVDDPCESMFCAFGAKCLVIEQKNKAMCKCIEECSEVFAPVCGSDGVTYSSECHLRQASCADQRRIKVRAAGACDVQDPCEGKECSYGAKCVPSLDGLTARCQCTERCDNFGDTDGSKPVCGNDGKNYANICELHRSACREMKDIKIKYYGKCDPCDGYQCPVAQICQLDEDRDPMCRCNQLCTLEFAPVCGSDGRTYSNECLLRVQACKERQEIRVLFRGECTTGDNPCKKLVGKCGPGQECMVDRRGDAKCVCPRSCEKVLRPVCGSDDITYDNECELRKQSCERKVKVELQYNGECNRHGPCTQYRCSFGAMCIVKNGVPSCECPTCSEEFEPVCGDDGISYNNECKLKSENCEKKKNVLVSYKGLCNGCENKKCDYFAVCESNGRGVAQCVCPSSCVPVEDKVCGTDGKTYSNECQLRVSSCTQQQFVMIASHGPCDLCQNVKCRFGARCENGKCVCPQHCPDVNEPVCANDFQTYVNECEMRRRACSESRELEVTQPGECTEEASGSGEDSGSSTDYCDETSCKYGGQCEYEVKRDSTLCQCDAINCDAIRSPVCGSDGRTYGNECEMRQESCRLQKEISQLPKENCEGFVEDLCDGNSPLVHPVTNQEFDCSDGRDSCPAGSYCHRVGSVGRCCKEDQPIRTCADTKYGCCDDGKTAAPGPNNAGCPSVCKCHPLGSFKQTCEPRTHQCTCKPGVGGEKCDRCEPGFWGLPKIAEGNSGCIPCGCNLFGSVRDDCEQMTGRCVCRYSITGMKCNICPNGKELGAQGCTDNNMRPPRSCTDMTCRFGAKCVVKDERAECVCENMCPKNLDSTQNLVCGSDRQTYASECQLRMFACRLQKEIMVSYQGACQDSGTTPAPYRSRKTTRHINSKVTEKVLPTQKTPTYDIPVIVPSFSGMSWLELKKLHHASKAITITMEFRSINSNGMLLYSGQFENGQGDFVSLSLKDGYVIFSYDLGSGAAIVKSLEKISLNTLHKVVAKRYGKQGMLQLDGGAEAVGESRGQLASLNLDQPVYLGYVPNAPAEVFKNAGVNVGLLGCIESLKIVATGWSRQYDLMYPASKDIEVGETILECGHNPCGTMPCLNGGTCSSISRDDEFTCTCASGYTGRVCDMEVIACNPNPCEAGGVCVPLPDKGYFCECPNGREGDNCQSVTGVTDISVPAFHGNSYLELPITNGVGQNLRWTVWFLATKDDGAILYSSQDEEGKKDFVSLNLRQGYLEFRYNLGSGAANIVSTGTVTLNTWHKVTIARSAREGQLILNDEIPITGHSGGSLTELNLKDSVTLGGFKGQVNPNSGITTGLDGAVQRFYDEDLLIDELYDSALSHKDITEYQGPPCTKDADICLNDGVCVPNLNEFMCKCKRGYTGTKCEKSIDNMDTDKPVEFSGMDYHKYMNKIHKKEKSTDCDSA